MCHFTIVHSDRTIQQTLINQKPGKGEKWRVRRHELLWAICTRLRFNLLFDLFGRTWDAFVHSFTRPQLTHSDLLTLSVSLSPLPLGSALVQSKLSTRFIIVSHFTPGSYMYWTDSRESFCWLVYYCRHHYYQTIRLYKTIISIHILPSFMPKPWMLVFVNGSKDDNDDDDDGNGNNHNNNNYDRHSHTQKRKKHELMNTMKNFLFPA